MYVLIALEICDFDERTESVDKPPEENTKGGWFIGERWYLTALKGINEGISYVII